jgi:hypothetical protein
VGWDGGVGGAIEAPPTPPPLHWELPSPVAAAILRAGQPGALPLAAALDQADRLARLRLLLDDGAIAPDDARLAALPAGAARVFRQIGPETQAE